MKFAVAKKIGMTQIEDEGKFVGVSIVQILPLVITQIKSEKRDGYDAVQVGVLDSKRKKKLNKPQLGHLKKMKEKPYKFREFRILGEETKNFKIHQKIDTDQFAKGDKVTISGMSYGRGFQGVIKRHHFHRGPKTHGSDHHRAPGSIGMCSFPARVFKGKKMPGRHGVKRAKIKNLEVIKIIKDKSLMALKGSVPGKRESYLGVRLSKKNAD
ncbi:50S ribosomal protein L3 [Patescibacteria group bacterium]|nr:50S ribosomal protein L3 [Patescibacteria group bacterium]